MAERTGPASASAWLANRPGQRTGLASESARPALAADEILDDKQRDDEQHDGKRAAAEPGLLESRHPAASSPQVAVRTMGAVGVPAHQAAYDQDNQRKHDSG